MLHNDKLIMFSAILLLAFAIIACAPEQTLTRHHDYQQGLSNWKCTVDNKIEQETKYNYNEEGELISIEFFKNGKPYFITSYLDYVMVSDDSDNEIKYRICTKQICYKNNHSKDWETSIHVIIINNVPEIKTMEKTDEKGTLTFRDEYEYDDLGRKISAIHTYYDKKIIKTIKYEYSYEDENNLGVVPEKYYFEIPKVFYNKGQYLNWCTLSSKKFPINEPTIFYYY